MDREQLAARARLLAERCNDPGLRSRAQRIAERAATGSFHVAVLGEFKRGKSTLVNALVGRDLLPMGVLPLTAVATEVSYGADTATIDFADGSQQSVPIEQLARWVTEEANPHNVKQVRRVRVRVPAPLLASGLTLVDTPGTGSVHEHNTQAARRAVEAADGAIVVLGAGSPLSEEELALLRLLAGRELRTFVVLNQADRLAWHEISEVVRFVSEAAGGLVAQVWPLSAKRALSASLGTAERDLGFDDFAAALEAFVEDDLAAARDRALGSEASRVRDEIADGIRVAEAAAKLASDELAGRVSMFRQAVAEQRGALAEDRVVLGHEVVAMAARCRDRLGAAARQAAASRCGELDALAASGPASEAHEALRGAAEQIVRQEIDRIHHQEIRVLDAEWLDAATRFANRVAERIAAVRAAASELFEIDLPALGLPAVSCQPERFSYLFLPDTSVGQPLIVLARHLMPASLVRRRALRAARRHLADECAKHAGRLRHDLANRLEQARAELERLLEGELERASGAILAAAQRGEQLQAASDAEASAARRRSQELLALAEAMVDAAAQPRLNFSP